MDANGRPPIQAVVNGHDHGQAQTHGSNGPPQSLPRPLNVDEALQYSSMSSSPVFGLGLKPNPSKVYMDPD